MLETRRKGWIGVDVGTHSVKLAQVERDSAGVRLVEGVVVQRRHPWPGEASEGDSSQTPLPSGEEIRAGVALGEGFSGRRATGLPPRCVCDLRSYNLPAGSETERRAMIENELAALFGAPREFDFWETPSAEGTSGAEEENVHVLSLSEPWAARLADDLAEASLHCHQLDGPPLALARAVELAEGESAAAPVAALDLGWRTTSLVVARGGAALYTRQLRRCNLPRIIDAVAQGLGLSPADSELVLTTHGLPTRGDPDPTLAAVQDVIADVAAQQLSELAEEVGTTLRYLQRQRRKIAPRRLYVLGGGAAIRNIASHLQAASGLETLVWELPAGPAPTAATTCPAALLGSAIALSSLAFTATTP